MKKRHIFAIISGMIVVVIIHFTYQVLMLSKAKTTPSKDNSEESAELRTTCMDQAKNKKEGKPEKAKKEKHVDAYWLGHHAIEVLKKIPVGHSLRASVFSQVSEWIDSELLKISRE